MEPLSTTSNVPEEPDSDSDPDLLSSLYDTAVYLFAERLNLPSEDIHENLVEGKTIAHLAEEQGFPLADTEQLIRDVERNLLKTAYNDRRIARRHKHFLLRQLRQEPLFQSGVE